MIFLFFFDVVELAFLSLHDLSAEVDLTLLEFTTL